MIHDLASLVVSPFSYPSCKLYLASEKTKTDNRQNASTSSVASHDDDETPNSRFVSRLLSYLLQGFLAKDKVVRYRSVSIVAELVSNLGELE